jgi:hypothetical protein
MSDEDQREPMVDSKVTEELSANELSKTSGGFPFGNPFAKAEDDAALAIQYDNYLSSLQNNTKK